jgi:hypothetical protein
LNLPNEHKKTENTRFFCLDFPLCCWEMFCQRTVSQRFARHLVLFVWGEDSGWVPLRP